MFDVPGTGNIPIKVVVAQIATVEAGGELTLAEVKERSARGLAEEGGVRRLLEALRKQTYVSVQDRGDRRAAACPRRRLPRRDPPTSIRMAERPRLAVTLGDVRGIGPEIVAAARAPMRACARRPSSVVVGPATPGLDVDDVVGEWHHDDDAEALGWPARRTSRVDRAIALAQRGEVDGIVTAPLDKHALLAGGYDFPGHTEMLAARTGRTVAMMLAATRPSRGHGQPAARRARDDAHRAARRAARAHARGDPRARPRSRATGLRDWFGIETPRIALCALNPHAGDGGRFGREDDELLAPAARDARARRARFRRTPSSCARCAARSTR